MEIIQYNDPSILWEKIQAQLLEHEKENNLFVGLLKTISENKELQAPDHLWFTVEDNDGIQLAGWRTPPFPYGLWAPTMETTRALECFLDFLMTEKMEVTGTVGKPAVADSFAALAMPRFKFENYFTMNQGIFEFLEVDPELLERGTIRPVTMDELELLTDWMIAFRIESLNLEPLRSETGKKLQVEIENGSYFFYEEDGKVLSTVAMARPMVNGISVNMVYTPPEYRKKGYATSCVALLTQKLLNDGWKFTALITDLDNPTSNSIYQKIGYKKVGESKDIRLRPQI